MYCELSSCCDNIRATAVLTCHHETHTNICKKQKKSMEMTKMQKGRAENWEGKQKSMWQLHMSAGACHIALTCRDSCLLAYR